MKKILTSLLTASLLSSTALAGDFYMGLDFDAGKGSTEQKNLGNTITYDFSTTEFGLHGGYYFNENSKIRISFKKINFNFDEGEDRDGNKLGVDYIYLFNLSKVKPYLGLGLSTNRLNVKISNSDSIDGIGATVRGGVAYPLTSNLEIGAELNYNYITWEDLQYLADESTLESTSQFFGLGLNINYKF